MTKTKLEIIEETAAAYANPDNRAISLSGGCSYLALNGNRCAVGRCLIEGQEIGTVEGSDSQEISGAFADQITNLEEILQPEYRGHPAGFWRDLQSFHDNKGNFTVTGISAQGMNWLEQLRYDYRQ